MQMKETSFRPLKYSSVTLGWHPYNTTLSVFSDELLNMGIYPLSETKVIVHQIPFFWNIDKQWLIIYIFIHNLFYLYYFMFISWGYCVYHFRYFVDDKELKPTWFGIIYSI